MTFEYFVLFFYYKSLEKDMNKCSSVKNIMIVKCFDDATCSTAMEE